MSDVLGRYYTENLFSNLLVQQLDCITPKTVLELGVGNGSILKAVRSEWDKVKYYGFDVDKEIVNKYDKEKVIIKYGDVLDESESKLNISFGKFDIAVCNPPYSRLKNENGEYNHLIQSLNFIPGSFPLTKDIVFLLKNLAYLKPNGKLGIIVPDTLITSHTYLNFRKQLLSNYEVEKIIELPSKIFRKTEAKTHILIVKNSKPTKKLVKLLFANKDGIIANENTIAKKALADRWDFSFNSRKSDVYYNTVELGKIATIKRGSFHIKV
ncbi:MAG: N-6 DNA methylase [Saprospiraceae bacterium]|nr:N-6 DNA methylase [Saprospiraceae bacterium]